jgi:hypothetical protein
MSVMRHRSLATAVAALAYALGIGCVAGGCSLIVDTSGLAQPPAGDAVAGEGGAVETSTDAPSQPGDAATEADVEAGPAGFVDLFDRPDDDAVGNGWLERTPSAFGIRSHAAEKLQLPSSGTDYLDNMVVRPPSDAVPTDLDALVEFTLSTPPNYPQMYLRGAVGAGSALDSYGLFAESDGSALHIMRQHGSSGFNTLTSSNISPVLQPGQLYRFRFHVEGADAVILNGAVDAKSGDSSWTTLTTVATVDSTAQRIQGPGLAGFSADDDGYGVRYSRFEWHALH